MRLRFLSYSKIFKLDISHEAIQSQLLESSTRSQKPFKLFIFELQMLTKKTGRTMCRSFNSRLRGALEDYGFQMCSLYPTLAKHKMKDSQHWILWGKFRSNKVNQERVHRDSKYECAKGIACQGEVKRTCPFAPLKYKDCVSQQRFREPPLDGTPPSSKANIFLNHEKRS